MKKLQLLYSLIFFFSTTIFAQTEDVDLNGAIKVGGHTKVTPDAGTIEWDGVNFRGFDGSTWRILDMNGSLNFPAASRAAAWLSHGQPIPNDQWTPVLFDIVDFDNLGEFVPSPPIPHPPGAVLNEQSVFVAVEDGYYQINARCEFDLDSLITIDEPDLLGRSAYVSIAIVVSPGPPDAGDPYSPSLGRMVSQGNNLQIAIDAYGSPVFIPDVGFVLSPPDGIGEPLVRNNAPNVSDMIHLSAGEAVSIWVLWYTGLIPPATYFLPLQPFHKIGAPGDEAPLPELLAPPPFAPDASKVYVSIHKES